MHSRPSTAFLAIHLVDVWCTSNTVLLIPPLSLLCQCNSYTQPESQCNKMFMTLITHGGHSSSRHFSGALQMSVSLVVAVDSFAY